MKQEERQLEQFLLKLQQIRIVFDREVSEINKNITRQPLQSNEVLDLLNKRYKMNIKESNFKMEAQVDTIGEHYVTTSFFSD